MENLSPVSLHIEDDSWKHAGHAGVKDSQGGHFTVQITAEIFRGKSRIACHRLIYDTLKERFSSTIHALSISAKAP
ncbi:MAG: BolA family protein [Mariprofundaceae bacterium]|nr:BolA family protein [Mariprofundaceae bacterium]